MRIFVILVFMQFFSSSATAETYFANCNVRDRYELKFKYEQRFIFKDRASVRIRGKWVDLCTGLLATTGLVELNKTGTRYEYADNSAKCFHFYKNTKATPWEELLWVVDFETMSWAFYTDGRIKTDKLIDVPFSGRCD